MIGKARWVFCAAGGPRIGIGHLARLCALRAAAQNKADIRCVWQVNPALGHLFSRDASTSYLVDSDKQRLEALNELAATAGPGPRVLITDLLDLSAKDALRHRALGYDLLVQMNESALNLYSANLTFNGDGFLPNRITEVVGGLLYEGSDYHAVDPRVVSARPANPWSGSVARRVIVSFGGADPGQMTEQFVNQRQLASDVVWTVVTGPAFADDRVRYLHEIAEDRYTVMTCPDNMTPLILNHDAVITMGGLTSYEAMCLGRPVLAVEWMHMAQYVKGLNETGLVATLGSIEGSLSRALKLLSDSCKLKKLAEAGWKTIDGRGANRIVAEIELAAKLLK